MEGVKRVRGQLQACDVITIPRHSSHIWQTAWGHFITRLKKLPECHYKYKLPGCSWRTHGRWNHRGRATDKRAHTTGSWRAITRSPGKLFPRAGGPGACLGSSWDTETGPGSVWLGLPARAEGAGVRRDTGHVRQRWDMGNNRLNFSILDKPLVVLVE